MNRTTRNLVAVSSFAILVTAVPVAAGPPPASPPYCNACTSHACGYDDYGACQDECGPGYGPIAQQCEENAFCCSSGETSVACEI